MRRQVFAILAAATILSCTTMSTDPTPETPTPPVAVAKPFDVPSPNGTRRDPWYWLRDDTRASPEVLAYLEAENAYTKAMLRHTEPLQERLFEEIVSRIKQDDSSAPVFERGYWYYSRYETGEAYPVYCRRAGTLEAAEEVLLDGNAMAQGHEFFQIGGFEISTNNKLMAYTVDTVGRRQYVLKFKELSTGKALADTVENVDPGIAWANDNRTVLYVEKDPETLLGNKVRKHVLGSAGGDPLVYEEKDESFFIGVDKSKSGDLLFIEAGSTLVSEWLYADASDPQLKFKSVLPREANHEYEVEQLGRDFIIRSNWQAKNFRIMRAPIATSANKASWTIVVPHSSNVLVDDFEVFRDFLAIEERSGGLSNVRIKPWRAGREFQIQSDEPAYTAALDYTPELDSAVVRYTYESMTTPESVYDYNVRTGEKTLVKREPVLGAFDPADYVTEFVHATARDGTRVPISLVHARSVGRDGTAPILVYGYGAYGHSMDPTFSSTRLSLLDRGFVFAIAHVRGGEEMGREWYEGGRLLNKKNTFTDFIDATRFLVGEKYASPHLVFAMGGSAGGLLMGAVANMQADLFLGIVTQVPFVDIVTTMLDESIPLTTNEYDEWGDPRQREYYDYMLSYSPYDNVTPQDYPAMLVSTGLWDSQVQYWEPAKWVAKLRVSKANDKPLLLHTNMEAGHGGKSGRFEKYRERAMEYAFMLDLIGIRE